MPYAVGRRAESLDHGIRLAHYTTARAAVEIIKSRGIWLRNAKAMHDFTEVHHGHLQLVALIGKDGSFKNVFEAACDRCGAGLMHEATSLFDGWWQAIHT